jgi:hypothetical protein
MPPDENPQPPPSQPEEEALAKLNRLRKRVPKFRGVEGPLADGTWRAQVRKTGLAGAPVWREVGIYPTCGLAWKAYQKAPKYKHRDPVESVAEVDRLMRAAESYPVQMKISQSLWRSGLSPYLPDLEFRRK